MTGRHKSRRSTAGVVNLAQQLPERPAREFTPVHVGLNRHAHLYTLVPVWICCLHGLVWIDNQHIAGTTFNAERVTGAEASALAGAKAKSRRLTHCSAYGTDDEEAFFFLLF